MSSYRIAATVGAALALAATANSAADTKAKPAAKPYHANIAARVTENDAFRRVLHTGDRTQLVAMQLPVGTDIGKETHTNVEQVLVIVSGSGRAEIDGKEYPLVAGDLVVAPKGSTHNIVNSGNTPLELYTVYAPPNHLPGRVHLTKAEAEKDKEDEAFGKKVR